jgi:hypothetical protein
MHRIYHGSRQVVYDHRAGSLQVVVGMSLYGERPEKQTQESRVAADMGEAIKNGQITAIIFICRRNNNCRLNAAEQIEQDGSSPGWHCGKIFCQREFYSIHFK